jgi:hypothetical protein
MLQKLKTTLAGLALSAALVAPSAQAIDVGTVTDLGTVTTLLADPFFQFVAPGKTFADYKFFDTIAPFDAEWATTPLGTQLLSTGKLWSAIFALGPTFQDSDVVDLMTNMPTYLVGPASQPSLLMAAVMSTLDITLIGTGSGANISAFQNLAPGKYLFAVSGIVPNSGFAGGGAAGALTIIAVPEPSTWAVFALGLGLVGFAFRRQMH